MGPRCAADCGGRGRAEEEATPQGEEGKVDERGEWGFRGQCGEFEPAGGGGSRVGMVDWPRRECPLRVHECCPLEGFGWILGPVCGWNTWQGFGLAKFSVSVAG